MQKVLQKLKVKNEDLDQKMYSVMKVSNEKNEQLDYKFRLQSLKTNDILESNNQKVEDIKRMKFEIKARTEAHAELM